MFELKRVFTGETLPDGTRELSVRVQVEGDVAFEIQSGLHFSPEYLIDGNLNFFKKRTRSKEELRYQNEMRDSFETFYDRIENIVRVSEGYIKPISLNWVLSVVEMDNTGQIKKKGQWLTLRDILVAAGQTSNVPTRIKGRRELYYFTKQYCKAYDLSGMTLERYINFSRKLRMAELYYQLVNKESDFSLNIDKITPKVIDILRDYFMNEGSLASKSEDQFKMISSMADLTFPRKKGSRSLNKNQNVSVLYLNMMKSVLKYLRYEARETDNYPFQNYEVGVWQSNRLPICFTSYELTKLKKLDLSLDPFLSTQRDILLFHCMTGCRYRDMIKLSDANVEDDELMYEPELNVKENIPAEPVIKLSKEAKQLISQYEGVDVRFRLFPFVSKVYYEDCCRKILEKANMNRIVFVHDSKQRKEVGKPLYEVFDALLPITTYRSLKGLDDKTSSVGSQPSDEKKHVKPSYRGVDDDVLIAAISLLE